MPEMIVWPVSSSGAEHEMSDRPCIIPNERHRQLLLIRLSPRLKGHVNDRLREAHAFEGDHPGRCTQRVARGGAFEPDGRGDIAREHLIDFVSIIRMHLDDASQRFADALGRVEHHIAGRDRPGIDTEEHESAPQRDRSGP